MDESETYGHMRRSEPEGHGWGPAGSDYLTAHRWDHERLGAGAGHTHDDYAPGGYVARDVLTGIVENGAMMGEPESAVLDLEYPGTPDTASRATSVLVLENGERYRITVEYVPEGDCDCPDDCLDSSLLRCGCDHHIGTDYGIRQEA